MYKFAYVDLFTKYTWIFLSGPLFEYWIEHITFKLLDVILVNLLGYSTGELQALQLVVLAVFG